VGNLTLLDQAHDSGLSLTVDADRLIIRGPRRAEAIARELMSRKAEVLALLAGSTAGIDAHPPAAPVALEPLKMMPWRHVLPTWPLSRRERWGRRANELAEAGVLWPEDERRAFAETLAEREAGVEPRPRNRLPPAEPSVPGKWRCQNSFCRFKTAWWMSQWGVVNCQNCVPPAYRELVVTQGTETDAPQVEALRSHQTARPAGYPSR
jgi:hypothetical protein